MKNRVLIRSLLVFCLAVTVYSSPGLAQDSRIFRQGHDPPQNDGPCSDQNGCTFRPTGERFRLFMTVGVFLVGWTRSNS